MHGLLQRGSRELRCLDVPLLHDFAAEFLLKVDSMFQDGPLIS